ncbi:MAG: HD domain-containing protein [Clostridiales bacterium]|nr:HD domain-containing protein [Clostridiales bacterium]
MTCVMFAAIDIGSYEVNLKIYELSARKGIRVVNHVKHRIELGKDAYATGRIGTELVDELCSVLLDFQRIMKEFGVEGYRACATSAIRETRNNLVLLDRIYLRTGIRVEVLSNSEQRFLGYKSIASNSEEFQKIIEKGTAIVDVGGGSIQISLFDKDNLVTTQNIRLGTLRLRERLADVAERTVRYVSVMEELLNNELRTYRKLYLKERNICCMVLVGKYIEYVNKYIHREQEGNQITREEFLSFYNEFVQKGQQVMAAELGISMENSSLMLPTLVIYKNLLEETGAERVLILGTDLADGVAYDYAEQKKILKSRHNFENDIIEAARNIAKRYHTNRNHTVVMEQLALTIYDKMKLFHGLGKRERLLLQIAVLLHDCGKYINMAQSSECSYSIIMATEIIGLSHTEREMVANTVRFNSGKILPFEELAASSLLERAEYMTIMKLTAILRVANALDRSHKQKIKEIRVTVKDNHTMQILVDTMEDLTLEQVLFREKTEFFEEVYSIRPILKVKRLG